MSLMLFPPGSCIPSVPVTLPLWILTSAHFSIPNSILTSPETILTVWTNVSISLVPLPNSLMPSMNIRWLIMLPPFLSWYPTSILSRTLVTGNIATVKSSGDSESPWKNPLLMLTPANLVPELVGIVIQLVIVFLRNLMVFSSASYISRHSISYEHGIMFFFSCCSSSPFCQSAVGLWCLCTSFYSLFVVQSVTDDRCQYLPHYW